MADEQLYGEAGVEADQGFTPMGEVPAPESTSDDAPITDWMKRREEEGEARLHTTERNYVAVGGENAGEPMPENQTVSIERAARDLKGVREYEAAQAQAEVDQRLAAEVDQMRHPFAAQAPDQQQQQQRKQQPGTQPVEVQPETVPEVLLGVDQNLVKLIQENPALQTALQAEVAKVEAARQTYQQGLEQNALASLATLVAEFPELQSAAPHEFPTVVRVLAETNPQRAQALANKIQTVNAIVGQFQQDAAQQRQRMEAQYRQQFAEWSRNEDDKFAALVPEVNDPRSDLGHAAVSTLRQVGFSDEDVVRAWSGDAAISLRDHRAQLILQKAAMYDRAQATAPQKAHRPVPPVQRPGVSRDRSDYNETEISSLRQRLARTGDARDAAKLLLAQRAARGG